MIGAVVLVVFAVLFWIFYPSNDAINIKPAPITETENTGKPVETARLEYKNEEYGFGMYLPDSWENYSIVEDSWEGYGIVTNTQKVIEKGPIVYIRHPDWDYKSPRQDIPVMVFTKLQWDSMLAENFHIGAGPINPTELGRNYLYVFAVPARYNFAFITGYEEVETILQSESFHSF
jgi:hypothetical protein